MIVGQQHFIISRYSIVSNSLLEVHRDTQNVLYRRTLEAIRIVELRTKHNTYSDAHLINTIANCDQVSKI